MRKFTFQDIIAIASICGICLAMYVGYTSGKMVDDHDGSESAHMYSQNDIAELTIKMEHYKTISELIQKNNEAVQLRNEKDHEDMLIILKEIREAM